MALICKDVFRDCLLPPQEYFEYGLWMPADQYRPDSEDEEITSEPEIEEVAPPVGPSIAEQERARKEAMAHVQKEWMEATGGKPSATAEQAAVLVRKQGVAPSQADIAALRAKKGDALTQNDVSEWIKDLQKLHDKEDNVENLVQFFKYYDLQNTGTLSKHQVVHLLKSFGEPLTSEEVERIFSELGVSGDRVDYVDFVNKLLQKP